MADAGVNQEVTLSTTATEPFNEIKMSKNQQKRLIREQKRMETKSAWRKLQKDKRKLKERTKRQEYEAKGLEVPIKKRIRNDPTKIKEGTVVFDVSFDGIMVNRETTSLCSQIMRCYSANRRAEKPFNLQVSGLTGSIAERFNSMYPEHPNWDMKFEPEHFLQNSSFNKENIIYLTPDTDNVLETVEADKTYIIGGIVDKNRFKGKTSQTAQELGLKTARLPVPEYIDLKSSPVLTVFHVLEILLKFKECNDWKQSLEAFVPQRNVKKKSECGDESESEDGNEIEQNNIQQNNEQSIQESIQQVNEQ